MRFTRGGRCLVYSKGEKRTADANDVIDLQIRSTGVSLSFTSWGLSLRVYLEIWTCLADVSFFHKGNSQQLTSVYEICLSGEEDERWMKEEQGDLPPLLSLTDSGRFKKFFRMRQR